MEQKKNKELSVVIPEYCGESMLAELLNRLHATLQTLTDSYEIILVNDCSPDNVWEGIRQVCAVDKRVVGLNLSRNFGEHYAISAGLRYAKGAYVVVMDHDHLLHLVCLRTAALCDGCARPLHRAHLRPGEGPPLLRRDG